MKVLVTGPTGFIGRHVVRILLDQGYDLRLFVRNPGKLDRTVAKRVEFITGCIEDIAAVRSAVEGCTHVIHLAALAARWQENPARFYTVNANGTAHILRAAYVQNVERVVYASSCSACHIPGNINNNEMTITVSSTVPTEYGRSKACAMGHVQTMRALGLDTVVVFPTRVFGAYETSDANAAGFILAEYLRGRFPFSLGNGKQEANWAYVHDVARGIVQSLKEGPPNAEYILGGENHSLAGIRKILDRMTGSCHIKIGIPAGAAKFFAHIEQFRSNVFHVRPFITPGWLETLLLPSRFDCSKAVNQLGYRITPIREALTGIVEWAARTG